MRTFASLLVGVVLAQQLLFTAQARDAFAEFDSPSPTNEQLDAFLAWFDAQGGVRNGVGLGEFEGMGVGIKALDDVKEGQTTISVPLTRVICRDTILRHESAAPIQQQLATIRDEEDTLIAFLILQLGLEERSEWAPYLQVLPRYVPVAPLWTPAELAETRNERVVDNARRVAYELDGRFLATQPVIEAALRSAAAAGGSLAGRLIDAPDSAQEQRRLYLWAASIMSSRALTLRGRRYLVPLADMANYEPHPRPRRAGRGEHFLAYHRVTAQSFDVMADRDVAAGGQVSEDYGDGDNHLYLQYHGFMAPANPFDCAHLLLPPLTEASAADSPLGAAVLTAAGVAMAGRRPASTPCVRGTNELPAALAAYLKIRVMSAEELASCKVRPEAPRKWPTACLGPAPVGERDYAKLDGKASRLLGKVVRRQLLEMAKWPPVEGGDQAAADPWAAEVRGLARQHRALWAAKLRAIGQDLGVEATPRRRGRRARKAAAGGADAAAPGSAAEEAVAVHGDAASGEVAAASGAEARQAAVRSLARLPAEAAADPLARFNAWFAALTPQPDLVRAAYVPGMRVGVVTTQDVAAEEVYLGVPSSAVMDAASAAASPVVGPVISALRQKYRGRDEHHEIMLYLMHEAFVRREQSEWAPYLDLLPTAEEMGFALFWTPEEVAELQLSPVADEILQNQASTARKFKGVKEAVFDAFGAETFPPEAFTQGNYSWASAVMDSRAIWWGGGRHLVPMLDLINCKEGPNPARVHGTVMDGEGQFAVTRAGWAFARGEQLWENYGQPNHLYLMYHGFVMQPNHHDCVRINLRAPDAVWAEAKHQHALQQAKEPAHALDEAALGALRSLRSNRFALAHEACLPPLAPSQGDAASIWAADPAWQRALLFEALSGGLSGPEGRAEAARRVLAALRRLHDDWTRPAAGAGRGEEGGEGPGAGSHSSVDEDDRRLDWLEAKAAGAAGVGGPQATYWHRATAVKFRLLQKRMLAGLVEHAEAAGLLREPADSTADEGDL